MEQTYSGQEPEGSQILTNDQIDAWISQHDLSPYARQVIQSFVESGQPLSADDLDSLVSRAVPQPSVPDAHKRPRYKPYASGPDFEKRLAKVIAQLADKRREESGPSSPMVAI